MSRDDELTVEQIAQLAKDVTRAQQLHPSYRGPGDPIELVPGVRIADGDVAIGGFSVRWPDARMAEPLTVGRQIDVYHVTIAVRVPADEAGRLPGFPGTDYLSGEDVDEPITGIDLLLGEAQHAAQDAVERVLFSALASGAVVGPGPDGGVVRVSVAYETPADRSF